MTSLLKSSQTCVTLSRVDVPYMLFSSLCALSLPFQERLYRTSFLPGPHPQRTCELSYSIGFRPQQSQPDFFLIAEILFQIRIDIIAVDPIVASLENRRKTQCSTFAIVKQR